jgi:thioredoxin:protein disulfide reductase
MNRYLKTTQFRRACLLLLLPLLLCLSFTSHAADLATLLKLSGSAGGQNDFLRPDQAFNLSVKSEANGRVDANFTPAPGYYLYRDRIKFTLQNAGGTRIAGTRMPPAEMKNDPYFGRMAVYHHPFQVVLDLKRGRGEASPITLAASFQGCSERGICYPPVTKTLMLDLSPAHAAAVEQGKPAPRVVAAAATGPAVVGEAKAATLFQDMASSGASLSPENLLRSGRLGLIVMSFFGFGLLLALTPCVFPMIPILSGIIAGQGNRITRRSGALLSLSYVLGMAVSYALVGVLAGLSGQLLSTALQTPWVLGAFALLFVALALSMFGFFELRLPGFLLTRATGLSNRLPGGNLLGTFTMGALSVIIVSPCVAAPLAGALLYIGQTHNVLLGGASLFVMALGMGAPLLLVGLSAGTLLPRAGAWMNAVKTFFGVVLLGVALWIASPLMPAAASMALWATLLIMSAVYLRAIDSLPAQASGFMRFWKGIGILLLLAGSVLLVGVLGGSRDVLHPLNWAAAPAPAAQQDAPLHFSPVRNGADLDIRVQAAHGRPVMLDFYADWCVSCKAFDHETLADPRVIHRLQNAVLLRADVTANSPDDQALLKRFGLFGPPGIILFDRQGQELKDAHLVGELGPADFLSRLDAARF